MSDKSICVRLSEDKYSILKNSANVKGISINKLLVESALKESGECNAVQINNRNNVRGIRFSDEELELLEKKAAALGLSEAEFLRRCIHTKNFVNVNVDLGDLREFTAEIYEISKKLNGIADTLLRRGDVYEQDVRLIVKIFTEMNAKCNEIYSQVTEDRWKLYEEIKKRTIDTIKEIEKKERRRKNAGTKNTSTAFDETC